MTGSRAPRRRLSRDDGRPPAPVRIVHLGVGGFFRAHQAWYTEHASDADDWGIAAFTGHSRATVDALREQDCLYTLLVRSAATTTTEVISAISDVHTGDDLEALSRHLASPAVSVVTLTVTEAGYCRGEGGGVDLASPVVLEDIAQLCGGGEPRLETVPARLVLGLCARREVGAGDLAIVSCDNVPDNGAMTRRVVLDIAHEVDPSLSAWIDDHVSFVTTMVDRITPRTTADDLAEGASVSGVEDPALVVTESFTEWVLAGAFPAGRPAWEAAGARFVDDVRPFETRKLWLLNGAHSILAYGGSILGYTTVAEAIADPELYAWIEDWWDCATPYLTLPRAETTAYRRAMFDRFGNPGIHHLLAQIATDGSLKIPIRVLPCLRAARAAGDLPTGATRLVAAWIANLRGHGAPVTDVNAVELTALAAGPALEAAARVLARLGIDDLEVLALVEQQVKDFEGRSTS